MSEFKSVSRALTYLAAFGSAAAIADEFESRGIRSKPGCPESCAVAQFITDTVGVDQVTVDGDEAFGFYVEGNPHAGYRESLPHTVHQFVVAFDRGEFPTLIAPSAYSALIDWSDVIELEDAA